MTRLPYVAELMGERRHQGARAAIPHPPARVTWRFLIRRDLAERLDALAREAGRTRDQVIEEALEALAEHRKMQSVAGTGDREEAGPPGPRPGSKGRGWGKRRPQSVKKTSSGAP